MRLHEVTWLNKYLLTAFGLWPMHPDAPLSRRHFANLRFIVGLFVLISFLVPEVATVAVHWGDIDTIRDFGWLTVVYLLLMLKLLYCKWRCRSFRSVYQHIKDFWNISDDAEERRVYERPAYLANLVTIVFYLTGVSNLLNYEAVACIRLMKNRLVVNESLRHRPLLLEITLGFNAQPTPTYELVFAWQSVCCFCAVSVQVGCDCVMMVFIIHVFAQFKLVAARFRAVGRQINERVIVKNELRAEIGKLIAQHQHTIRVADELSWLLSPVMFCQIMCSGLQICLSGYALIEGDGNVIDIAKFLVIFVTLLIQLVVFCAPAEFLIQESSAVAEAIYREVPWFKLTPSLQRDLGFAMMRAQKGCHVTALHQVMSIRRITEVFNAAASYLALLRSMKN